MSIAFGLITNRGELIAASDRRETVNGIYSNDNHEKTFKICGNRIIGSHTGLLFFNGKRLKEHLVDITSNLEKKQMTIEMLNKIMNYLKGQIELEPNVAFEYKKLSIIFLLRIENKPIRAYFEILPIKDSNELSITQPIIEDGLGTFKPFGNPLAFDTIYRRMLFAPMINPVDESIKIMKSAIQAVYDVKGESADCGGIPSVQYIKLKQ